MGRRRIHLLGKREERHTTILEVGDDRQQVGKRAAKPIELPNHQAIALLHVSEASLLPRPIVAGAGGLVGTEVAIIDAGSEERIALQIDRLTIVGLRHAHVSYDHATNP